MLRNIKRWARKLLRDVHAVYLAAHDPRVPWYAKVLALAVAAYALSPIDLIPEFIPVLGPLDDAVVAALILRHLLRRAGAGVVSDHWRGINASTTIRSEAMDPSKPNSPAGAAMTTGASLTSPWTKCANTSFALGRMDS